MWTPPLMTGPIPAYSNPPIEPQYYQPRFYFIDDIYLGQTTTVTTTVDHDYVVGQLCRLIIPPKFGCTQLNDVPGYVISIPAPDQVVLSIDSSRNVDSFQSSLAITQPQIIAIGDVNTGQTNTSRSGQLTYIPGSFINISPL